MNPRPVATISQEFMAVELENKLFLGDFTWAVAAAPACLLVVQDKLTKYEAEQLALALNRTAEGFRGLLGMERPRSQQVLIDFEAVRREMEQSKPRRKEARA